MHRWGQAPLSIQKTWIHLDLGGGSFVRRREFVTADLRLAVPRSQPNARHGQPWLSHLVDHSQEPPCSQVFMPIATR